MSMQPGGLLPGLEPQGPDTKRLLITVTVVTVMWMGFQLLSPPTPPPEEKKPGEVATQPTPPAPTTTVPTDPGIATPSLPEEKRTFSADVAQAMADKGEKEVMVKGGYKAEVTSHGAQLSAFKLDGYSDALRKDEKTGELPAIDLANGSDAGARVFALRSRAGDVPLAADAPYEVLSTSDPSTMAYRRQTSAGVVVERTYRFDAARFAFVHEITLKNESAEKRSAQFDVVLTGEERPGERDEGSLFVPGVDQLAGVCHVAGERETFRSTEVEEEPLNFPGSVKYAGLDRHYFLAAIVFDETPAERCQVKPFTKPAAEAGGAIVHGFQIVTELREITLAPGEVKTLKLHSYFGPKQIGLLEAYGNGLEENIDFGIFGIISRPMLWILVKFKNFTGNFGIAIILLTLLMKILTFPLNQKSYVSMQQVKKLKPQIDELNKKYGHDRQLLGQKQMELYQKNGINPLAGCFPILVQMPIWFALYRTLSMAVELYQQPFYFGIVDLTQPDMFLPFGISLLPLIVGALMLVQTWIQPPPADQPQMKYMMWFMPFFFTFLMLQMPSGLSIYMITNSILTMAQQLYIKKKYA